MGHGISDEKLRCGNSVMSTPQSPTPDVQAKSNTDLATRKSKAGKLESWKAGKLESWELEAGSWKLEAGS
jgi:hypothetical protein